MKEEGVIKFKCQWKPTEALEDFQFEELNQWRNKLYSLGMLGVTEDGIGYGNISIRSGENKFIISGSGTGKISKLAASHYTKVTAYSLVDNSVACEGPVIASSESLTHAAIYQTKQNVSAVFHVHQHELWKKLLQIMPSTEENISYGTPEMAFEVSRLIKISPAQTNGIFAMGGHEDGIVSFGKDPDEAGNILLKYLGL